MPINKLRRRPATETQATSSPGEWKHLEFYGDNLKFNSDASETKTLSYGDVPLKIAKRHISGVTTGLTAWQNPESGTIIITNVQLYATTVSSGASTIDVGTTATSATTTSDNIFDGLDGTTTAPVLYSMVDPALDSAANVNPKTLASGKWITVDSKTGDLTGFVGDLYVYYITLS